MLINFEFPIYSVYKNELKQSPSRVIMSILEHYEKRVLDKALKTDDNVELKRSEDHIDSDASLDEILEELEDNDDEFLQGYREQRLQQIATEMRQVKSNVENEHYGQLRTVDDEREIMKLTSNSDQVVIHFGLENFKKCGVMDSKLSQLAPKHLLTRFLRVSVDKCPFLVTKLQIKVLPFVVAYKKGVERTRIVGFSRLGNQPDDFDVSVLEKVLFEAGVLANKARTGGQRSAWQAARSVSAGDSDSDLDV
ncbi:LAME_0E03928g1_1 [Lachancea meyersii CBS 8951]|uniref:LAME_0E03928g1_1 n=1 Tax=Lachancea meyersii CBS 8951 TaxID=1266667 RepID=A0A1G4JH56_9SACH|nr:LAME_0E03928g1_1 [Lachancea meyersii CBS 8951]